MYAPLEPSAPTSSAVVESIKQAIDLEVQALTDLRDKVDLHAAQAVELLYGCRGRVIVTGMGKAGLIGRKIAGTLASTGTPALFLHPADALHGDLGVVSRDDVVVALSNSGETEEVVRLLPHVRRFGVKVIALTGKSTSSLAKYSDVVIDVGVQREADPLGIVPTASTTAALAMGDALAAALLHLRGFAKEQFAIFHPDGSLGRRLLLRVRDIMHSGDELPRVLEQNSVRQAIYEMSTKRLGATFVITGKGELTGIFTDGDVRRLLQREDNPLELSVGDVMTITPKTVLPDALAAEALLTMEHHRITLLAVVDGNLRPVGALHLHDLLRAGLA